MSVAAIDQPVPDFSLPATGGNTVTLSALHGRKVVLYFYPKDNTPGCTREACGFRDVYKLLEDKNTIVLGVSRDSLAAHQRFIADNKLPFVLLSDPQTLVMKNYGAWGEKKLFGLPTIGPIRSTVLVGPNGVILKHWESVA